MPNRMELLQLMNSIPPQKLGEMVQQQNLPSRYLMPRKGFYKNGFQQKQTVSGPIVSNGQGRAEVLGPV